MKKQFLAFLMLTAMFWGCNLRKDVNYTTVNPENLEQAKLYFQNNQNALIHSKSNLQSRTEAEVFSSPEFLTFTPLWDKTIQTNLANGNKVLITPVSRAMYVKYQDNLYFIRRLRTELNRNGRVVKAHIVELVTLDEKVAEQKDQIITNFFTEIETRTNARLIAFDIGYNFVIGNTQWQGFSGITESTHCYNYNYVMICNVMFVYQEEVPCPNDDNGDDNGTARSAGQRVESCGNGGVSGGYTGGGNQDPPGGGGSNPSDTGQDQAFIPDFVDYNGVNIQLNYRNAQGDIVSPDTNVIKAFKFVIDNSTFRTIIKDYLSPNIDKLTIKFDINTRGGKFDPTTNIISFNPNLLSQGYYVIDLVQILVHEGIHAMFAKPSTTVTTQITTARSNLVAHYSSLPNTEPLYNATPTENMVQHETMGEYYLNDAVTIIKAFDRGSLGKNQNNTNITDDAYKSFFLGNLIQVETPLANQTGIINMFITKLSPTNLSDADFQTYNTQFKLLRDSYK